MNQTPNVLCFSGHDPSGGAGIQADIETLNSHQCHCCSIITSLTEQDSYNVKKLIPQQADNIRRQAETLFADFEFSAIKIGLIGDVEIILAIHEILTQAPHIPVVFDPVLAAGGGKNMANESLINTIVEQLLPLSTIITPNSSEAIKLAQQKSIDQCGEWLQKHTDYVLITGADEQTEQVVNRLYMPENKQETFTYQRLPHQYHGSGCTLASAIAALLAHDLDPFTAILEAQEFTWNALQDAYQPGQGQHNPNRLFWMEQS